MKTYELGARVYGDTGRLWGRLAQLVLQPLTHIVSHAVVYSAEDGRARLVPIALTRRVPRGIQLSCGPGDIEEMTPPVAVRVVVPEQESAEYRIEAGEDLPAGTVPVWQREPVHATDGDAGRLLGVVFDEDGYVATHFLVEKKRLWSRKRMTVPVEAVSEMTPESIRLRWNRAKIEG